MLYSKEQIQKNIQECKQQVHSDLKKIRKERLEKEAIQKNLKRGMEKAQCRGRKKGKRCQAIDYKKDMFPEIKKYYNKRKCLTRISWYCKKHKKEESK